MGKKERKPEGVACSGYVVLTVLQLRLLVM